MSKKNVILIFDCFRKLRKWRCQKSETLHLKSRYVLRYSKDAQLSYTRSGKFPQSYRVLITSSHVRIPINCPLHFLNVSTPRRRWMGSAALKAAEDADSTEWKHGSRREVAANCNVITRPDYLHERYATRASRCSLAASAGQWVNWRPASAPLMQGRKWVRQGWQGVSIPRALLVGSLTSTIISFDFWCSTHYRFYPNTDVEHACLSGNQ